MKTSKRKREVLTIEKKYEILKEVEKAGKQVDVARRYGLPKNTLSGIIASKETILAEWEQGNLHKKSSKGSDSNKVDDALLKWFADKRSQDIPISGLMLATKAKEFADALDVPKFQASNGFLHRFKKRNGVLQKTIAGESNSADQDVCAEWVEKVLPSIVSGYEPQDIFNADETALFYRVLPHKTLEFKGKDCRGGKLSKERVTVLLIANQSGDERLKPIVIGRAERPRCLKNIDLRSLPVSYYASKKAWMTGKLWLAILGKLNSQMVKQNRRILLFVDNVGTHRIDKATFSNVRVAFLPKNCTSVLQPLDQGIINSVKAKYRSEMVKRLLVHIDAKKQLADYQFTLLDCMRLLGRVWNSLANSTIQNCFRKAGFKSAHRNEDPKELLADDHENNIFELARTLMGDALNGLTMSDYVSVDEAAISTEPLNEKDILDELMHNETESPSDREVDEQLETTVKPATCSEVLQHLQAIKHFCAEHDLLKQFDDLEDAFLRQRLGNVQQKTIPEYFSKSSCKTKAIKALNDDMPCTSRAACASAHEILCAVCNNTCDGAHFCKQCYCAVHAICGETSESEEGYGAPLTCRLCLSK